MNGSCLSEGRQAPASARVSVFGFADFASVCTAQARWRSLFVACVLPLPCAPSRVRGQGTGGVDASLARDQSAQPEDTVKIAWCSLQPERKEVVFFPRSIAARLEKAYCERDRKAKVGISLGNLGRASTKSSTRDAHLEKTVHFLPTGECYETSHGGYRSVKRCKIYTQEVADSISPCHVTIFCKQAADGEQKTLWPPYWLITSPADAEDVLNQIVPPGCLVDVGGGGSALVDASSSSTSGPSAAGNPLHAARSLAPEPKHDVDLSKLLSKLLRHKAHECGVTISADGWVDLADAVAAINGRSSARWSATRRRSVVRYTRWTTSTLRVRSTTSSASSLTRRSTGCGAQGHTMVGVAEEVGVPLTAKTAPPLAVHGSYLVHLGSILSEGLRRMNRHHIHLATGLPGERGVVSACAARASSSSGSTCARRSPGRHPLLPVGQRSDLVRRCGTARRQGRRPAAARVLSVSLSCAAA